MFLCPWNPTHSVTFGRLHVVAKPREVCKYTVNGTFGFALPREACRNELYSLIFSYQLSVRGGEELWKIEGERDLDSMRVRERQKIGESFKGHNSVDNVTHQLFIDWLVLRKASVAVVFLTALHCTSKPIITINPSCKCKHVNVNLVSLHPSHFPSLVQS